MRAGDKSASVTVRDNGPGVPEDKLALIFEPFYRVDDSRGTSTGGMGLGLALANNAMEAHSGGIALRNLEPHGLEIMLLMRRYPAESEAATEDADRVAQTASKPG